MTRSRLITGCVNDLAASIVLQCEANKVPALPLSPASSGARTLRFRATVCFTGFVSNTCVWSKLLSGHLELAKTRSEVSITAECSQCSVSVCPAENLSR